MFLHVFGYIPERTHAVYYIVLKYNMIIVYIKKMKKKNKNSNTKRLLFCLEYLPELWAKATSTHSIS